MFFCVKNTISFRAKQKAWLNIHLKTKKCLNPANSILLKSTVNFFFKYNKKKNKITINTNECHRLSEYGVRLSVCQITLETVLAN